MANNRKVVSEDSLFDDLLDMCKIAWRPVLDLLAREGSYSDVDFEKIKRGSLYLPEIDWPKDFGLKLERIRYLSFSEVVQIHDVMIREFGGESGILNPGIADSVLDRIRFSSLYGIDLFPDVIQKAAMLMHSILTLHPFVDGQKRTGISSAFVFLGLNGYSFWSRDVAEDISTAIQCAEGKVPVSKLAEWIASRAIPLDEVFFVVPWNIVARRAFRNFKCPSCGTRIWHFHMLAHCVKCSIHFRLGIERLVISRTYSSDEARRHRQFLVELKPSCKRLHPNEVQGVRKAADRVAKANENATNDLRKMGLTRSQARRLLIRD